MYLSLSLRAWDCVASARRGLPLGRKIYLLTYEHRREDGARDGRRTRVQEAEPSGREYTRYMYMYMTCRICTQSGDGSDELSSAACADERSHNHASTILTYSLRTLRRRDRYLCVACRPHTRPQRFSPRRRELARAPQTHHTHRKPRHPTLASRSKRECAPLQHAAHMTQAMSSFTSTHHVASNAHKAPRNAPGTLSRPSRAHSNAPIPAQ